MILGQNSFQIVRYHDFSVENLQPFDQDETHHEKPRGML